jgi:hypothetical protein
MLAYPKENNMRVPRSARSFAVCLTTALTLLAPIAVGTAPAQASPRCDSLLNQSNVAYRDADRWGTLANTTKSAATRALAAQRYREAVARGNSLRHQYYGCL